MDHDNVIQTFSPYRPDQPFCVGILPRGARSTQHFLDAKPCCRFAKYFAVIAVTVAQQKTRSRIPGEGLQELLGCPLRGRIAGDRKVHYPAAVMGKDYEHKQQSKCGRWNHEEIGGGEIFHVVYQ